MDSSNFKDPCDYERYRKGGIESTGEAHFPRVRPSSSLYSPLPLVSSKVLPTNSLNSLYSPYSPYSPLETVRNKPSNKGLGLSFFTLFLACLTFSVLFSSGKLLLFQETLSSFFPPETSYFFNSSSRIALEHLNAIYQIPFESPARKAKSSSVLPCLT